MRLTEAKLLGATRLLKLVEDGLMDRDVEACRAHVVELQARLTDQRLQGGSIPGSPVHVFDQKNHPPAIAIATYQAVPPKNAATTTDPMYTNGP